MSLNDEGLTNFRSFKGIISTSTECLDIEFQVKIDASGEVGMDFGTIALTNESAFIKRHWMGEGSEFGLFQLCGISEDGTEFDSKDVYFTSDCIGSTQKSGAYMRPAGGCSTSVFRRPLKMPFGKPQLLMHLKGFQGKRLNTTCELGNVSMAGQISIENSDMLSGYLLIEPTDDTPSPTDWRQKSEKLLHQVRQIMSFAAASNLKAPVLEFRHNGILELQTWAQIEQVKASMRTFHYLDQQAIFETAVKSAFDPAIKLKNLLFAIDWFAMDTSYSEVRLVNAMTSLENLVASNLTDADALILPKGVYKRYKRVLRTVIEKCTEKWSTSDPETSKQIRADLDERLTDLNRRTILQKIELLAKQWSVPLCDIGQQRIKDAKRARDLIVHTGRYYEEGEANKDDLWEHVTVVREVVVRFVLSALSYEGSYISHVNGYHHSYYPPTPPNA
jgi:hypothetical protein